MTLSLIDGSVVTVPLTDHQDLTPLDFCLWGLMKSEVYRKKVDTRDELLVNILDVIVCIKEHQDALRQTTRHVFTRVAKCTEVDGGIFKHLL